MAPVPAAAAESIRTAAGKRRNEGKNNDRVGNHAAGEDVYGQAGPGN